MIEFYPQIKQAHLYFVATSGALFLLRGCGVLAGSRWPMKVGLRYLSYGIDSALLTSALMLISILPRASFANGWLISKLLLVTLYIVLGSFALRADGNPCL